MSTNLATAEVEHFFVTGAAGNRIHGLDFGGTALPWSASTA